eukprot:1648801-Rhodomonas_salina.3
MHRRDTNTGVVLMDDACYDALPTETDIGCPWTLICSCAGVMVIRQTDQSKATPRRALMGRATIRGEPCSGEL